MRSVTPFSSRKRPDRALDELAGLLLANGLDLDLLEEVVSAAGLAPRLRDYGFAAERLGDLAEEASTQWTARFNPREVRTEDLRALYESAF